VTEPPFRSGKAAPGRPPATIPPHCRGFQAGLANPAAERDAYCQSNSLAVSLRLNVKRGIVWGLDAAGSVRIRD